MPTDHARQSRADHRFGRTVAALMVAGFIAVLAAGTLAAFVVQRSQRQTGWVNHTFEVERHVGGIRLALEELRSARRAALLGMRINSGASYVDAWAHLEREIGAAASLTRDNPAQQGKIAALRAKADRLDELMRASLEPTLALTLAHEQERQDAAQAVEAEAERMLAVERHLLALRIAEQNRTVELGYLALAVAAVLLVGVGVASVLVVLRYTRDLTRTRDALRTLNADLEGAVRARTIELSRANEEIQRFAYIVSHDLRSPLVNIMGFTAEMEAAIGPLSAQLATIEREAPALVQRDAREAVTVDLPESLGFIRTSTQKMDRLINAILRLSREGRRNITPETIELGGLAHAVVDGIRHLVDERGATIEIADAMPRIVSDRLALEQILSNLVENALKYLSPQRAGLIRVSAEQGPRRTVICVVDNGRGIDPRDHARVFDLFRRSGTQDQPGEGIGLAHVRALAYRLGGTISVRSALDEGATFLVDLPNAYVLERDTLA